jgi:hypothetical protein
MALAGGGDNGTVLQLSLQDNAQLDNPTSASDICLAVCLCHQVLILLFIQQMSDEYLLYEL